MAAAVPEPAPSGEAAPFGVDDCAPGPAAVVGLVDAAIGEGNLARTCQAVVDLMGTTRREVQFVGAALPVGLTIHSPVRMSLA